MKSAMKMISYHRLFMLLMFGFFALAAGCFIMFLHPYDFFFRMKVELTDGGEIFEMWRKPEVNLYCRVFLFNVTNAEEYMAGIDDKIKVKEVGPYVYKEGLEHEVLRFNDNNTLSAIPKHPLTWVPELSEGNKEDDQLYLANIALLSIANVVSSQSFFTRIGLNNLIGLTNAKPLVKMTAREFMMGYKSELMTLGNTFMPGWIYFDKLGLIDRMYDFNGDYETIFTGKDDVSNAGLIDTYKGSTDLPQWEGKHCSNLQYASDGTKFKGGVSANESILFFRKSLCRAAPLIPMGEGVKSGLKAYKYGFPEHMLDNGKIIKENQCFCRKGKCLPEGLIDVTDCYYGFPIALSYPHYYKGDDVLFTRLEGLTPNKELHETRFWIQPDSGLPIDVSSKFQINMALEDISSIKNTERFANMYLPLLWFDIRMYSLPPSMESRFKLYLNILPIVEQVAMYLLFVAGAVLILLTVYRLTFKIMFKTFDSKKQRNFVIGDLWIDREKNANKDGVYSPCEIPLSETEDSDQLYDNERPPLFDDERRPSLLKTHSDKIKELSHRLSDKVYDSVGSIKDKVREITHAKHIFSERSDSQSLINRDESQANEAYKSDSSDTEKDYNGSYLAVRQSDSDDDCKYLEILDDGSEFASTGDYKSTDRENHLKKLDSSKDSELIIHISD
ncbi:scavenger receptor class B member 1-like isoform X2 [Pectinophora gossypiella]|uniref:scavenger receptor class B member 1-like isoform X2 n=1 Tax=Pectinophora gossypiella TaxID=13191 RepID=UPI00214EE265|nr:scavenger receptor class B member 1-like isoform X2 [Pectinophora gossypiella]